MDETKRMNGGGLTLMAALLALGLVGGGWALGAQIKAVRLGDRYVSVRGLAERKVKADIAIWPLDYKEAGDDLPSLYAKTEADRKAILQFLKEQGIEGSEVELGVVNVLDTQAQQYGSENRPPHRYIVNQEVLVVTPKVDQVAAAAQKTLALLQRGIVLGSGNNNGVSFRFTGLNAIKPDMITEATRNARAVADRFAADSGSRLGSIRLASQGVFSISPEHAGVDGDEEGGAGVRTANEESGLMKTVRVVTSVQYYLEK